MNITKRLLLLLLVLATVAAPLCSCESFFNFDLSTTEVTTTEQTTPTPTTPQDTTPEATEPPITTPEEPEPPEEPIDYDAKYKNMSWEEFYADYEPAKSFVKANTGLSILDTEYVEEDYAIAIAKNNTALLEKINKALDELIADGTVQSIIDKYIPAE